MAMNNFSRQRGVAMLEFTIVLPLMLFLTLAVTEFGRAMIRYNALTKSVQDGARHVAANAAWGTSGSIRIDAVLLQETLNLVVYGNTAGTGSALIEDFDTSQISVSQPAPAMIRVEAAYPYPALFNPLPTFGLGSSTDHSFLMQASVTMRAL